MKRRASRLHLLEFQLQLQPLCRPVLLMLCRGPPQVQELWLPSAGWLAGPGRVCTILGEHTVTGRAQTLQRWAGKRGGIMQPI